MSLSESTVRWLCSTGKRELSGLWALDSDKIQDRRTEKIRTVNIVNIMYTPKMPG